MTITITTVSETYKRAQHGGAAEEKRIDPTMAEEGGYFDEGRSTSPLLSLT